MRRFGVLKGVWSLSEEIWVFFFMEIFGFVKRFGDSEAILGYFCGNVEVCQGIWGFSGDFGVFLWKYLGFMGRFWVFEAILGFFVEILGFVRGIWGSQIKFLVSVRE